MFFRGVLKTTQTYIRSRSKQSPKELLARDHSIAE